MSLFLQICHCIFQRKERGREEEGKKGRTTDPLKEKGLVCGLPESLSHSVKPCRGSIPGRAGKLLVAFDPQLPWVGALGHNKPCIFTSLLQRRDFLLPISLPSTHDQIKEHDLLHNPTLQVD